jgi:hypothetical protein
MGRAQQTLDANLNTLLGDANPNRIMQRYFREYGERARRQYVREAPRRIVMGLAEARLGVELASQQIRQNAIRVSGIQRKVDVFVSTLMSVLRFVFIAGAVVLIYDQLLAAGLLPQWARFQFLDHVAKIIAPYPIELTVIYVAFGLYLVRQAGNIKRRYKEPVVALPDNRLAE